MTRSFLLAALAACFLGAVAHAERTWSSIVIPGAVCGDGKPYQVMVSNGDPRKIAFDLMGGGACWSFETCFGPSPHALIHPLERVLEVDGFVSDNPAESPAADFTMVYFPYCTGDVHIGDHDATYSKIATVHHRGKRNFENALGYLQGSARIDLARAEEFIMYGYSAGAIGALFHMPTVSPLLTHAKSKVVLADAPGLHFGKKFWKKFPPEFIRDFAVGMERAGVRLRLDQGNISALVPAECRLFPQWRFGILQGSRDMVMSTVFGNISPNAHEKLLYSAQGVYGLTLNPNDNCATWAPSTTQHTFLVTGVTARLEASGKSAMDFAFETALGTGGPNYR